MFQICALAAMYAIRASSREGGHDGTHPCALPHCHSAHIIKGGKSKAGTQRYKGLNTTCPSYSLQLDLIYKGRCPAIKEQIVAMALKGSGIRDTARVLKISPTTVLNELKKKSPRSAGGTTASLPWCTLLR
jgi:transposase-like protein